MLTSKIINSIWETYSAPSHADVLGSNVQPFLYTYSVTNPTVYNRSIYKYNLIDVYKYNLINAL